MEVYALSVKNGFLVLESISVFIFVSLGIFQGNTSLA